MVSLSEIEKFFAMSFNIFQTRKVGVPPPKGAAITDRKIDKQVHEVA